MRMTWIGVALGLLAAATGLAGCVEPSETEDPTRAAGDSDPLRVLAFSTIDQTHSGVQDRRMVTVTDNESWDDLWTEHQRDHYPPAEAPGVDFSEMMVIALFHGSAPSTCFGAAISSIESNATEAVVYGNWTSVGNVVCGSAVTNPSHLVKVARLPMPIRFAIGQRDT